MIEKTQEKNIAINIKNKLFSIISLGLSMNKAFSLLELKIFN